MHFEVSSNPDHSVVLWFHDFKYCWLEELMKHMLKQAGGLESRGGLSTGGGLAQHKWGQVLGCKLRCRLHRLRKKLLWFWQRNSFGEKWWGLSLQRQEQDWATLCFISFCWTWEVSNPEVMQELCWGCGEGRWALAVHGMTGKGCQSQLQSVRWGD